MKRLDLSNLIIPIVLLTTAIAIYALSTTGNSRQLNSIQTAVQESQEPEVVDLDPDKLFDLVNDYREDNGLVRLVKDERLCRSANRKAQDMVELGYYDHKRPDGSDTWFMIREAGFGDDYETASENLVLGVTSEESSLSSWKGSVDHNEAMLASWDASCIGDAPFTDITIPEGSGLSGDFMVQHFIRYN